MNLVYSYSDKAYDEDKEMVEPVPDEPTSKDLKEEEDGEAV